MEWIVDIIKALLTLAGVFLTVRYSLKGKKLEVASAHDEQIAKVKDSFNNRLDRIDSKLDDIKTEQLKVGLTVTQLQKDLNENNNVVKDLSERVTALEKTVAVLDDDRKHRLAT